MELIKRGLFFERFVLKPAMTPEAVRTSLVSHVDTEGSLREWWKKEPYSGTVDESGFVIVRRSWFRMQWKPTVSGTIRIDAGQTLVEVEMSLHPIMLGFTGLVLGVGSLMAVVALLSALNEIGSRGISAIWGGVVAVGFVMLILGVATASFWIEAGASRRFLTGVLEVGR